MFASGAERRRGEEEWRGAVSLGVVSRERIRWCMRMRRHYLYYTKQSNYMTYNIYSAGNFRNRLSSTCRAHYSKYLSRQLRINIQTYREKGWYGGEGNSYYEFVCKLSPISNYYIYWLNIESQYTVVGRRFPAIIREYRFYIIFFFLNFTIATPYDNTL